MTKISFAEFQERALYGPRGFFTENDVVGRRGDFITSPTLGNVFARVLGNAIDAWWDELDQPSTFTFLDCGGADGTLAKSVGSLDLRCREALRYTVVERSKAAQERLAIAGLPWLAELPEEPVTGVVFANELLDNMPISLFEFTGNAWWEVCYDERTGTEVLREVLPFAAERLNALIDLPRPGMRTPLQTEARGWVSQAVATLVQGRVVCIDYARTTQEMAELDQASWLRTYRNQQPGGDPFEDPGSQDITCDVALDQMPEGPRCLQAEFLERHGIEELRQQASTSWQAAAAEGGMAALTAKGVLSEIAALMDPVGLGGFTVFEWTVETEKEPSR